MKGSNTAKMTEGHLRSFRRLMFKMRLSELEYYFPVSSQQLSKIRSGQHWGQK